MNVAAGVCCDSGYMGLRLDIVRLYNSIRIGGYMPWAAVDTIVMPNDDERRMKKLLRKLAGICAEYGVDIVTGHTEVNSSVAEPIISLTMMGISVGQEHAGYDDLDLCGSKRLAGMDIVMCGQTGVGGTLKIYYDNQKELLRDIRRAI